MMHTALLVILGLGSLGVMSASAAPVLPVMPSQWSTVVEANIVNKNYTTVAEESYDYPNNRVSFVHSSPDGSRKHAILLYHLGASIRWTLHETTSPAGGMTECSIEPLAGGMSMMTTKNGHMKSSAEFFDFSDPSRPPEQYAGTGQVRGIPTDIWTSTHQTMSSVYGTMDMNMTYHFVQAGWSTHGTDAGGGGGGDDKPDKHTHPVRAELQGSFVGGQATHRFNHIYDFINYRVGPPPEQSFLLPGPSYFCGDDKECAILKEQNWDLNRMCNATLYCHAGPLSVDGTVLDPLKSELCKLVSDSPPHWGPPSKSGTWHTHTSASRPEGPNDDEQGLHDHDRGEARGGAHGGARNGSRRGKGRRRDDMRDESGGMGATGAGVLGCFIGIVCGTMGLLLFQYCQKRKRTTYRSQDRDDDDDDQVQLNNVNLEETDA